MTRSSANFISYDLRPAKQTERRILLDLVKIGGDIQLPILSYRYIGMGANQFYDFLLAYKYLGISEMISLEREPNMYNRAIFNNPYEFIQIRNESVYDFLAHDDFRHPSVVWFDYDNALNTEITRDIFTIAPKMKIGDYCFVTVHAGISDNYKRKTGKERIDALQETFEDLAGTVDLNDVAPASFYNAIHKIILITFKNAFAARTDAKFRAFLQVKYKDSQPMITVGGALLNDGQYSDFHEKGVNLLPFLKWYSDELYNLKLPNMTDRERVLFDLAATKKRQNNKERNQLTKMGFKDAEISAYRDLLRFIPRYVETMV